jgi:hypothetical protein
VKKTVKLAIEVQYDDDVTDEDSIATAADRLLETVLSTPGILEDYGDPQFGAFIVAAEPWASSVDGPETESRNS